MDALSTCLPSSRAASANVPSRGSRPLIPTPRPCPVVCTTGRLFEAAGLEDRYVPSTLPAPPPSPPLPSVRTPYALPPVPRDRTPPVSVPPSPASPACHEDTGPTRTGSLLAASLALGLALAPAFPAAAHAVVQNRTVSVSRLHSLAGHARSHPSRRASRRSLRDIKTRKHALTGRKQGRGLVSIGGGHRVQGVVARKFAHLRVLIRKHFGRSPRVTSTTGGRHVSAAHSQGRAIDFVVDGISRQGSHKIEELARKAGLSPYNEYIHGSKYKTGDHMHVSG